MANKALQRKLRNTFEPGKKESPHFRQITNDEYRQLETGIYNTWGRRMNITPRVLDENGVWTGEYKDWSHLEVIQVRNGFFEYLNATWLFIDQRPTKVFDCFCKEATIFDKKCIVIQELHHDTVSAKILTDDEELKIHIEDVLCFKPLPVVPRREIYEINDLEHQGLQFGSSQLKINMNEAEEQTDKDGMVITNIDHYDNYTYEVYDSLRNIFKHISIQTLYRRAENQAKWLEDWIEQKELHNDEEALAPYMTDEVIRELKKYTYQNKDMFDRKSCGGFLCEETEIKKFSLDEMDYIVHKGRKMEEICQKLDIPVIVGWDIWKLLNKDKMQNVINELNKEYPPF